MRLLPRQSVPWHSTGAREELLIGLRGELTLELQHAGRRNTITLHKDQCAFLSSQAWHRVVNRSRHTAHYLYLTA